MHGVSLQAKHTSETLLPLYCKEWMNMNHQQTYTETYGTVLSLFTNTLRIFAYSLHSLLTQERKNKDTNSNAFNSNNENTKNLWFFFRRCTSLCVLNKRPRFHAILNVTLKLSLMYGNMDSTMCLWMIQFHTNNTIQHIHSAQNEQLFMAQSIWHNQ